MNHLSRTVLNEQIYAAILAGAVLLHTALLGPAPEVLMIMFGLLAVAAFVRIRSAFPPTWVSLVLLSIAIALGFLHAFQIHSWPSEPGCLAAAALLVQPVTPRTANAIIFCCLLILCGVSLDAPLWLNTPLLAADVAALLLLCQQIHRPPEARISIWNALLRAFKLAVPVAAAVALLFWIFPNILPRAQTALVGFSGAGVLDPSGGLALRLSRREAFTARFEESVQLPRGADLYWRGRVLDSNHGLRWEARSGTGRMDDPRSGDLSPLWSYSLSFNPGASGALPLLEGTVSASAHRRGKKVAVASLGANTHAVSGLGTFDISAVAAPGAGARMAPPHDLAHLTSVPASLRADPELTSTALRLLPPHKPLPARLDALTAYFRTEGFSYTLRPDRFGPTDVATFLRTHRKGYCEHYAAAAANLLRLADIPARVVTGYRGGRFNPIRGTITVLHSDAHAWVEVWDEANSQWLRYDPTDAVAPALYSGLDQMMTPDAWPWTWRAAAWLDVLARDTASALRLGREHFVEFVSAPPIALTILGLILGLLAWWAWLASTRRLLSHHATRPLLALRQLEQASLGTRARRPSETPLAWLARLATLSSDARESSLLHSFAAAYEMAVYSPSPPTSATRLLEDHARLLRRLWRTRPPNPTENLTSPHD